MTVSSRPAGGRFARTCAVWPRSRGRFGTASIAMLALLMAAGATRGAAETPVLGSPPSYTTRPLSQVPNARAIRTRIWVPGLDEGYVPQGLTFAEGQLLVSLYKSTEIDPDRGSSRVYRVHPETGAITGRFDLPDDVEHPGGLAYGGQGVLWMADRGKLYRIDLARALATGDARGAVLGRAAVDRAMGPAFLTWDGRLLWMGRHTKAQRPQLFGVDPTRLTHGAPLGPSDAERTIEIPFLGQGATFDSRGRLWFSQSNSHSGWLNLVDPTTGAVQSRYELMAGLEDLARSPAGTLWSVSEAGTRRFLGWSTFYPVLFEIIPGQLE